MQNRQKVINLLGLAQRAGKLITGTETVIDKLKQKKIKAVIMASDIQDNTDEKVRRAARKDDIPMITEFSANELEKAIGKKRKVLGLIDAGFAKALVERIHEGV